MATEYFIMAGDRIVDQIDVPNSDRKFHAFIREIKAKLSVKAQAAFSVVSEYEMYPDDDFLDEDQPCSKDVFNEIQNAWFKQ